MCKLHLVVSDKRLVDTAIQLILMSDRRIELVSSRTIASARVEETTDLYKFRRGDCQVCVAIIVGDRASKYGPFDGSYWIYIASEPRGFFRSNRRFAREIYELLEKEQVFQQMEKEKTKVPAID